MEELISTYPSSLFDQSLSICIHYPHLALLSQDESELMEVDYTQNDSSNSFCNYKFRKSINLPPILCERLFQRIIYSHSEQYLQAFSDVSKCRLTKINLSVSHTKNIIHDQELMTNLFHHPLQEINLQGCEMFQTTLSSLHNCKNTLKVLDLSSVNGLSDLNTLKELTNLVKLNLQNVNIDFSNGNMAFIRYLPNLVWLDLSNTSVDNKCLQDLGTLGRTLSWLSLHQCVGVTDPIELIKLTKKLQNLVHLDVSKNPLEHTDSNTVTYPVVDNMLMETFSKLPKLMSLDISGSINLTMSALSSFNDRQPNLKFLGLCNARNLSYNAYLPAEKVAGEGNEEQILTALEVYADRLKFVSVSLRKLFSLASRHGCQQIERCMRLILKSMRTFKKNNGIHIASTASLYHLSRENDPANSNAELRRDIILAILESMENLEGVLQLQKNSCLTFCNFKIPTEVEFQYFRVAERLLTALKNHHDDYLRRIAIMLFNAIVCQNAGNQKKEIGLRGAIETVMQVIKEKLESPQPDQLMETCWSSLWNITDETPENCYDFLKHGGMYLFVDCLNLFPDSLELHRNMMGLMGNVAEVKDLRPQLMQDEYIDLFVSLLSGDPESLEVSYNSAGLLSHVLSDGPMAWKVRSITRDACMQQIINCIESWDINANRNINYRSFKPIIGLLDCYCAPAAQHWSAWALANLSRVYPHKYCKLVEEEGGLEILGEVITHPMVSIRVKELAKIVIENCARELSFR